MNIKETDEDNLFSIGCCASLAHKELYVVISIGYDVTDRGEWGDLAFGSVGSIDFLMG